VLGRGRAHRLGGQRREDGAHAQAADEQRDRVAERRGVRRRHRGDPEDADRVPDETGQQHELPAETIGEPARERRDRAGQREHGKPGPYGARPQHRLKVDRVDQQHAQQRELHHRVQRDHDRERASAKRPSASSRTS
jgi:hypothetical protein